MMTLEKQYHDELKKELHGVQYSSSVSNMQSSFGEEMEEGKEEALPDMQQIAEDTENLSKIVMPRKKRGLYEAMQVTLK